MSRAKYGTSASSSTGTVSVLARKVARCGYGSGPIDLTQDTARLTREGNAPAAHHRPRPALGFVVRVGESAWPANPATPPREASLLKVSPGPPNPGPPNRLGRN